MIKMCVLFGAQDVLDLVNDDYIPVALPENATDVQRNDQKTLFYIH